MNRTAKCHCGALIVEVKGEPVVIVMCHCEFCQRRTGTSYNLGAWFAKKDLRVTGETKQYTRTGDTNSEITFNFCPTCGSNLFWEAPTIRPDYVGVAVGGFVDPNFPRPTVSLYGRRRHCWLTIPTGVVSLVGGRYSEQE
jgi:hypothetical protein